jgi:hypothetical protein
MPIQADIDAERRVKTVVFSGQITAQEFGTYSETLSADHMSQYDVVFIDLGQVTDFEFGYKSIRPHANRAAERDPQQTNFTEIIWAPTDIAYGLARMYQTLVAPRIDVQLFRDESEARSRLASALHSISSGIL